MPELKLKIIELSAMDSISFTLPYNNLSKNNCHLTFDFNIFSIIEQQKHYGVIKRKFRAAAVNRSSKPPNFHTHVKGVYWLQDSVRRKI